MGIGIVMKYIWQSKSWPDFFWDNDKILMALGKTRFCQGQLLNRIRSLGLVLGRDAQAEVLVDETVKTSAIEGTTLDANAVRSSVARRLGLPTAGLPSPDRYIDGMVAVLLDATTQYEKSLTDKRLKGWQAALFPTGYSGLHKIRTGKWRGPDPMRVVSGPIGSERIHYEAPPHGRLAHEMKMFFSWWKKSRGEIDGLIRAGVAHFYFVTIHPFEDGNGRVARAITDMALAQDENLGQRFYSVSSQILTERKIYYDTLESTQKGGLDITGWILWFVECVHRAILNSEKLVATILAKADFWHRHGGIQMSDRQRKVINRLLDAGKGGFEGGLTTRKYVALTKASRATAFREINDLLERDILKPNKGGGRNVSYDLNWG